MKGARALTLAARYPQSAEVLGLVAAAYDLIGNSRPLFADLQMLAERIQAALHDRAPEPLRAAIPGVAAYYHQPDPFAPSSFFARLALEAWARHAPLQVPDAAPNECPRCGHAPQLGVLRTAGNGDALFLACSLCRQEWAFRRGTCPECGETDPEKISFYTAEGLPQVRTQACQSCHAYLHLLLPEKDFAMIPDVDELAFPALDVWATEQGLHKVWPNLAGL
ncbi:MAG: formate dehydrogenase accessory protein FdhE [Acidobacteria bacterium]|nr:formate dehydrogenase accessory protein FdhE [Acidobacteriota bacterium]